MGEDVAGMAVACGCCLGGCLERGRIGGSSQGGGALVCGRYSRCRCRTGETGFMMNVLHLIPDLGLGGAQRALCYLATAMDRNRFQMQVAIWGPQEDLCKELEVLGVDVVRLRGVGRSLVRLALALGSHVRQTRPDVIHTHLFDADLVGTVVARACGVQCCSTIHSATFFEASRHRWRYRCLALLISRFFPVSQALSDALIQQCRVPAARVRVIRNGIDTTRFAPSLARDGADARGP